MAIEIVVGNKEIEATKMPPDSLGLNPIQPDAPVADGGKGIKLILNGYFFSIKLNARKTLDGNIMVYDHPNIDIVIIPTKNKSYYHDTYPVQKRFFDFLESRGAIVLGSTRGGVVYNSLETYYPTNEELDVLQVILLLTKKFLEEETENSLTEREYEEEVEQLYTNPDDDDSTELGEVPQAKKKGAIDPNYKPYNLLYRF